MQLLDPSAIKRDKPYKRKGFKNEEMLDEFERVQKIYDAVMLQEELKHVLTENLQLKAKIKEIEVGFKKDIDAKANQYKKFEALQVKKAAERDKDFEEKVSKLTQQKELVNEMSTRNVRF